MHILVVPSWYSSRRNPVHGSFFKEQAKALQNCGHKVTIAYNEIWPLTLFGKIEERSGMFFQVEEDLKTFRYKNYNFYPKSPLMFKSFNRRLDKMYKAIVQEEGKPDVIHAHSNLWAGISASYISEKYNIPLVITEHSYLTKSKYLRKSYLPHIKEAYDKAKAIITVSNRLREEIAYYTTNRNMFVIPNLVDLSLFYSDQNKKRKGNFRIFSLAFIESGKGMDALIKAFTETFRDTGAELIIGGEGSEKEALINLTIELNMQKQIKFPGALSREKAAEEMNKCDVFALASRYETFGMVYIEALACGKPVIATKNGGAEEIVKDFNGILTNIDDISALSKAMIYIKENLQLYDPQAIREDCITRFGEKTILSKINKVYEEILWKRS